MTLGIVDLLSLFGFDRNSRAKMVRHQDARYPADELIRHGWFDIYQAYQSRAVFHKADYVLAFSGLERNRALSGRVQESGPSACVRRPNAGW